MNLSISEIFNQKLAEIESRLAGISSLSNDSETSNVSFENYLSDASLSGLDDNSLLDTDSSLSDLSDILDSNGDSSTLNVLRAKTALANSTAYIPSDSTELMALINSAIDSASQKYGVDKNLIRAVIKQESSFNPKSISSAGAQGLMQLMPGTADGLGVKDPFNISQNINGGTLYLKEQLANFSGDVGLALAAYNAGPNSVTKYGGVPPYAETQDYVQKVSEYYNQYKMLAER